MSGVQNKQQSIARVCTSNCAAYWSRLQAATPHNAGYPALVLYPQRGNSLESKTSIKGIIFDPLRGICDSLSLSLSLSLSHTHTPQACTHTHHKHAHTRAQTHTHTHTLIHTQTHTHINSHRVTQAPYDHNVKTALLLLLTSRSMFSSLCTVFPNPTTSHLLFSSSFFKIFTVIPQLITEYLTCTRARAYPYKEKTYTHLTRGCPSKDLHVFDQGVSQQRLAHIWPGVVPAKTCMYLTRGCPSKDLHVFDQGVSQQRLAHIWPGGVPAKTYMYLSRGCPQQTYMYLSRGCPQQRLTCIWAGGVPSKDLHVLEQGVLPAKTYMYLSKGCLQQRLTCTWAEGVPSKDLHVFEQRSPTGSHGPRHVLLWNRAGMNLFGWHRRHHRPDLTTSSSSPQSRQWSAAATSQSTITNQQGAQNEVLVIGIGVQRNTITNHHHHPWVMTTNEILTAFHNNSQLSTA